MDYKQQYGIFQESLKNFESVLLKYGFKYVSSRHYNPKDLPIETMGFNYLNHHTGLKMSISFNESSLIPNIFNISFSMSNKANEWFSLSMYEENSSAPKIEKRISASEDYEHEVNQYFSNLKRAFETYLNDQIEGRKFINHSDVLMDLYYSHGAVQEMQEQVIEKATADRKFEQENPSLLIRLKKLFR